VHRRPGRSVRAATGARRQVRQPAPQGAARRVTMTRISERPAGRGRVGRHRPRDGSAPRKPFGGGRGQGSRMLDPGSLDCTASARTESIGG
jgi:hypothetical protein